MRKLLSFLSLLGMMLLSPSAFALLFDVVPTDASQGYLGTIFGGNIGTVYLGPNPNPTLSLMFERFNFIIVTVGVVVLAWIGFVTAVQTAREGEPLGKKLTVWLPIRAMFGMLMMVPTPGTGYSVIQITVIWIVLNGIGAANSIWNIVLDQLQSGQPAVGPTTSASPATYLTPTNLTGDPSSLSLIGAVLNSKVCMYVLNNLPNNSNFKSGITANRWDTVSVNQIVNPTIPPTGNNPLIASGVFLVGYTKGGGTTEGLKNLYAVYDGSFGFNAAPPPLAMSLCGWYFVGTQIANPNTINTGAPSPPPLNSFNANSIQMRLSYKMQGLQAAFDAVDSTAQQIAKQILANTNNLVAKYGDADTTSQSVVQTLAQGAIVNAANAYFNSIMNMYGGVRAGGSGYAWEISANPSNGNLDMINQLKSLGWIHAGSYYFALSQGQQALDPDAGAPPNNINVPFFQEPPASGSSTQTLSFTGIKDGNAINNPCTNQVTSPFTGFLNYLGNSTFYDLCAMELALLTSYRYTNIDAVNVVAPVALPIFGANPSSYGPSFMDKIVQTIFGNIKDYMVNGFLGMTGSSGGEPLSNIAQWGNSLMSNSEAFILGYIAAMVLITLGLSPSYCLLPFGPAVHSFVFQLIFLCSMLFILLWSTGAMLGLYLPMIPYFIFLTTAFGWMIAVAEALVGAPIIALGLVHPSGEELGKAAPAISILANIFLRPTLMIFGFIIAASLMRAGLTYLNFGFASTVQLATNGMVSSFGFPAILAMYMALVVAIVNKAFSLIHLLPDQILRWMGGTPEKHGETAGMVQEAHKGFEKGAAGGHEAGSQVAKRGQETMMKDAERVQRDNKDDDDSSPATGGKALTGKGKATGSGGKTPSSSGTGSASPSGGGSTGSTGSTGTTGTGGSGGSATGGGSAKGTGGAASSGPSITLPQPRPEDSKGGDEGGGGGTP